MFVCYASPYNIKKRNCDSARQAVTSNEESYGGYRETVFTGSILEDISENSFKIIFTPYQKTSIYTVNSFDPNIEDLEEYIMSEYDVYKKFDRQISLKASYISKYETESTLTQINRNFKALDFYLHSSGASGTFEDYRVQVNFEVEPFKNGSLVTYTFIYSSVAVKDIETKYVFDIYKAGLNAQKLANIIGVLD
jgi:hypothetical protein